MNGMINVYKEKGYTSHDVVAKLRGICHQKKIGHTGTLDPDAEGVLPICLGTATKVCELLTEKDKVYEAVLILGKETDTQDTSGTILRETSVQNTKEEIQAVIDSFIGDYSQIPPMYSALKVNGKKLCDLARAGVEVERRPRQVCIYEIETLWIRLPRVKLRVHCSKGTYIRTLCHDIGQTLGCGGCMEELLRTKVSIFELEHALTLNRIQKLAQENRLHEIVLPMDRLFLQYPKTQVKPQFHKMLQNGNRLPGQALICTDTDCLDGSYESAQVYRIYLDDLFYGLYMLDEIRADYKPVKIFGQVQPSQKQPVNKNSYTQSNKNLSKKQFEKNNAQENGKSRQRDEKNGGTEHEI